MPTFYIHHTRSCSSGAEQAIAVRQVTCSNHVATSFFFLRNNTDEPSCDAATRERAMGLP